MGTFNETRRHLWMSGGNLHHPLPDSVVPHRASSGRMHQNHVGTLLNKHLEWLFGTLEFANHGLAGGTFQISGIRSRGRCLLLDITHIFCLCENETHWNSSPPSGTLRLPGSCLSRRTLRCECHTMGPEVVAKLKLCWCRKRLLTS